MESQHRRDYKKAMSKMDQAICAANSCCIEGGVPYLIVWFDNTGLKMEGTQTLTDKIKSDLGAWTRAGAISNGQINSKDPVQKEMELPDSAKLHKDQIRKNIYARNPIPKTPVPLNVMNEKEMRNWVPGQIMQDVMETRGISLGQVQWGNPDSEPSFWPNELMHWSWVKNIAQNKGNSESLRKIGYSTEILMVDILRIAVLRRLQSRVIDWRQWVESDADQRC